MRRLLVLCLLAARLVFSATAALAADWSALSTPFFTNLGRDQGLPHPVAMALAQDDLGFVWVGTQGGLSRYDGYRFVTFLHQEGDPASLPSNVIADVVSDAGGRLWVGSFSGDVARFDPATDGFESFPEAAGTPPRSGVDHLISDGGDGVWVATAAGIEHIDGAGRISRTPHLGAGQDEAPADHVRALLRGKQGDLWVATDQGLWLRRRQEDAFTAVAIPPGRGGAGDSLVLALSEADDGAVWFATAGSLVGRIDPGAAPSARLIADLSTTARRRQPRMTLLQGRPGELWVGQFSGGISVIDMASGTVRSIVHDREVSFSLAENNIRAMLKDRSGLIWVSTSLGVSRFNPLNDAIDSIVPTGRPGGLIDTDSLALAARPDGAVWVGTKEHGVALLDPRQGRVVPLEQAPGLAANAITGLVVDHRGHLWVDAISTPGLFRLDPARNLLVASGWTAENGMAPKAILDWSGALWLAAGPLVRYDPVSGASRVFRHGTDAASLTDDSVGVLGLAAHDGLWVGSRRGLDLFDPATEKFQHLRHVSGDSQSLPGDFVSALLTDRRGRLWVGTLGNGLGVADPGEAADALRFRHLGDADGLPNDNIGALLEDDRGRIWASTANGLAVIDGDSLTVRALGPGDGVTIAAYWVGAAAKLADGSLLFGGGGGITLVHPERLGQWDYRPPIVVTGVRIDGAARPAGPVNHQARLTLTPAQRSIAVEFAALDYSAPDKLHYAYQLEGFDRDWITSDATRRVAAYTNLPPGAYRLLIRGSNRDGAWSDTLTVPIVVQPAWWQTWWCRALLLALAAGGIVLLVQIRTAFLRHRSRVLERLVASQTRDLTEANRRLAELASRDPLTNIFNRRSFYDLAEREVERARRTQRPISLLMIDVDHFKRVNDRFGHSAGDAVLRGLVAMIQPLLRDVDIFARIGGEELVVMMPETAAAAARLVAERLRQAVAASQLLADNDQLRVTISVGLATACGDETLASLIERADQALYIAKAGGRDRVIDAAPVDVA